jgi:hypothetical protein
MTKPSCPTRAQLLAFILDTLSEADSLSVVGHVEHCSDCQQRLETLADPCDPVLAALCRLYAVSIKEDELRACFQSCWRQRGNIQQPIVPR